MADKKISALTGATTPLAGSEVLPIVQSGSTVKVSVDNLTAGKTVTTGDVIAVKTSSAAVTDGLTVQNLASAAGTEAGIFFSPTTATGNIRGARITGINDGSNVIGLKFYTGTGAAITSKFEMTADGNLAVSTAGKGIDFSANGGDVLSQYDEGTYTPVFTASSSNPTVTYGLQRGKYVRVGNSVTVSVFITWSALSGGSGDLQISLPFAGESSVGAGAAGAIADLTGFTFAAGRTFCSVRPNANVLYATFPQSGSAVSTSNTTVAQTASSGLIVFSCTYLV